MIKLFQRVILYILITLFLILTMKFVKNFSILKRVLKIVKTHVFPLKFP